MSDYLEDGGPAFPESGLSGLPNGEFIHGRAGMSLRAYIATKAMHGLMTEPVSNATSLVQYLAPIEEGDAYAPGARIARAAVVMADALLDALAEPRPEPEPKFPDFNIYAASDAQRDALRTLQTRTWFEQLPDAIRAYVTNAVDAIARNETGEDDIPF
jgi:hypothetical protein